MLGKHKPAETPGFMRLGRPQWSPDGNQILFENHKGLLVEPGSDARIYAPCDHLGVDIYVMNVDGTDIRQLTGLPNDDPLSLPGFEAHAVWSPDGSKIAYSGGAHIADGVYNGGIDLDIFVMNADGSDAVSLGESTRNGEPISWGAGSP